MEPTRLEQIAAWTDCHLQGGHGDALVTSLNFDTRKMVPGELFVALEGARDGHDFVQAAIEKGGAGAIVKNHYSRPPSAPENFALLKCADPLTALQTLGRVYRRRMPAKIIGITGSNGKTSCKDLTAAALSSLGPTQKTQGNLNNFIGVPQSLLALDSGHQFGVFEMGMNQPGEIELLASIGEPDHGIITNVGTAHIGMIGSRVGIFREKGMLAEALPMHGVLVLDPWDDFTPAMRLRTSARVVLAGLDHGDVFATGLRPVDEGTHFQFNQSGSGLPPREVFIPLHGQHMVQNATMALGLVTAIGGHDALDGAIAQLRELRLTAGRVEIKQVGPYRILDDSYNANPESMIAALRALPGLVQPGGKTIAVLGAMGELGEFERTGYQRVGQQAGQSRISALIVCGVVRDELVKSARDSGVKLVREVSSHEEAATALRDLAEPADIILLKGSRTSRMEAILPFLESAGTALSEPAP